MTIVALLVFNLLIFGVSIGTAVLGWSATNIAGMDLGLAGWILSILLSWGLLFISVVGNFAITVYGAYAAAKKGLDLMGCGVLGGLAHAIVGIVMGVLQFGAGFIGLGANVLTAGDAFGSVFAGFVGVVGMGIGICLGLIIYVALIFVNIINGLIGGFVGGAK